MIHSTAIIHPKAQLHSSVQVGPYAVIDESVVLGADCIVGPHVHLTGVTQVGARNRFHAGCVIGDAPQDLKYANEPTRLRIGDDNVFREHATVHRSNKLAEDTVIGSSNFIMAHAHIGHNCLVGNHAIIANGALLGGHVTVQDRVFISGHALLHQFVRVGTLAIMQGGAGISKDLPPYTIATGVNEICGLNIIGLRRAGLNAADRIELKRIYRTLFRSGLNRAAALEAAKAEAKSAAGIALVTFVAESKRGCCADVSGGAGGVDETE